MINIKDIFANASSGMSNPKYRRASRALEWRQKYQKSEYYEMGMLNNTCNLKFKQIDNGELKGLGTGSFVWPAAHVLSKYLEKQYNGNMNNLNVVDVGSGTGCTGFAAAALGAHVTLTDQECILFLLEENKQLNNILDLSKIDVQLYNWGEDISHLNTPFDIILVSDCVLPKLYPIDILLNAVLQLMTKNTIALFSYEHRPYPQFDPRKEFVRLANLSGLQVENISINEHDDIYCCDDIELWKVTMIDESKNKSQNDHIISSNSIGKYVEPLDWGEIPIVPIKIRLQSIANSIDINIIQNLQKEVLGTILWSSSIVCSR